MDHQIIPDQTTMGHQNQQLASSIATTATTATQIVNPYDPTAKNPPNTVKIAAGYILQEKLGSGSFANVYKGIRPNQSDPSNHAENPRTSVKVVAIKAISRSSKKLTKKVLDNLDLEIAILQTYRHPNIVALHHVQKTQHHLYLILEYCGGGDLQRLIRSRKASRLSERLTRRLVRDLSAGLGFLWGKELVHRDIKPQNLLLTGDLPPEELLTDPPKEGDEEPGLVGGGDGGRTVGTGSSTTEKFMLKIADFGFARHLGGVDLAETMCGSPLYMAPEILLGQKYDAKADLWSVGTVLFEMIAGKPPFNGQNHFDLLKNIQHQAVRLPNDVRVSKECVQLLRILLARKPPARANFQEFFEACDAFVGLGCNGTTEVSPSLGGANDLKPLRAKMDLCAISENNEGVSDSSDGKNSEEQSRQSQQQSDVQTHEAPAPSPSQLASNIPNMATTQLNNMFSNAMVQVRQDHLNRPGVVTPPLNPLSAPAPPPALSTGVQESYRLGRPSVFTPLQGSPNLPPSMNPTGNPPVLSLQDVPPSGGAPIPAPRTGFLQMRPQPDGVLSSMRQQQQHAQQQLAINRRTGAVYGKRGSIGGETFDSGFVLVEHSGCRSRPGSGNASPAGSIVRANNESPVSSPATHHAHQQSGHGQSPSSSPYSSNRVTIIDTRSGNTGLLSTSPCTGRALVGNMMGSVTGKSNMPSPPISGGSKFNVSPRSALKIGGCLAHIESLAKMLAVAEDIGRRSITVAHLGDVRAYMAMGLLVARREESQSSSRTSCTPMEGVEEGGEMDYDTPFASSSTRLSIRGRSSIKNAIVEEEEEDDEMPFALSSELLRTNDVMSQSPANNIISQLAPLIGTNNVCSSSENKEEITTTMIISHFREALMCYIKTLTMMKGSIRAAKKVMNDVDDVINRSSSRSSSNSNNPYTPLKKRCTTSLDWLTGQFSAVLERANAANEQTDKLQNASQFQKTDTEPSISVEELIYNHSLKCGREGAVKQLLGHYDAARSCFRSAGLLLETLLMEPKIGDDDRAILQGYVESFADQINELDGLLRNQMKASRVSGSHVPMAGRASPGFRRQSGGSGSKPSLSS
mmetsp:Transcript_17912/g.37329  ORF Transcript_17912/g.37329 Transcript_17912/m.37329 type:complete len:1085 (-) Transcript_17912:214-3468(-)